MNNPLRNQHGKLPAWYLVGALLVLLTSIAYRFSQLDYYSLWSDELWGVMACSKGSWMAMVRNLVFHDNHPPGYQTILYFVIQWFGRSDFIIRLPSAIAGVLAVLFTLHAARKLFNCQTALFAGLLIALSHEAIYYSQEARAYSLLMLSCIVSTYAFIRIYVEENDYWPYLALFAVSATANIYLHYAGVVFFLCQALLVPVFWLYAHQRDRLVWVSLFCFGMPFMLYLKWLPVMYHHMTGIKSYWAGQPTPETIYQTYHLMLGNSHWLSSIQLACLMIALALSVRCLVGKTRSSRARILSVLGFLSTVPVLLFFLKSVISQPVYTHRHFIFIIPLVAIISAAQISSALEKIPFRTIANLASAAMLLTIVALSLHANRDVHDKLAHQDFRSAAKIVAADAGFLEQLSRGQAVVIASHDFFYHYLWANRVGAPAENSLSRAPDQAQMVRYLIARHPAEVYFLQVEASYYTEIKKIFDSVYSAQEEHQLTGVRITKYRLTELLPPN